eukprot:CAMPEP_0170504372 /NCGR_PEP_ID=MMETSP0208-20121228/47669_1 /TAXON_ID=197538 /ORGANISM="Strombidium inclinatum, Strain S3" /LENGTH=85 /DNA_ID=CAMNT_0010784591 /DNA_START=4465 /DNA_END=4722 /DNA_ORIENTATION=+
MDEDEEEASSASAANNAARVANAAIAAQRKANQSSSHPRPRANSDIREVYDSDNNSQTVFRPKEPEQRSNAGASSSLVDGPRNLI